MRLRIFYQKDLCPPISLLISFWFSFLLHLRPTSWMSFSAILMLRRISRASVCETWGRAALSVSLWSPTLTQVRADPL